MYPGVFPHQGKVDSSDHEEVSAEKIDVVIWKGSDLESDISLSGFVDRNSEGSEALFHISLSRGEAKRLRDILVYALQDPDDREIPNIIPGPKIFSDEGEPS